MLYVITGTNLIKREKAKKTIKDTLFKKGIKIDSLLEVSKITSENYTLLPNYFGGSSLFGEKVLVNIEGLLTKEETRVFIYNNLENLEKSDNVFILDDPFALAATFSKIERDLKNLNIENVCFNCKDETKERDINPFPLCDFIELRNKKSAWEEWKKIYLEWENKEAPALHGALWWKWKMMWSAYIDGDKNKFYSHYKLKDRKINYSKKELEDFGREIAFMATSSHSKSQNLMRNIEKFILKI